MDPGLDPLRRLAVVSPVYGDVASVRRLLPELAEALAPLGVQTHAVLVDDGSAPPLARELAGEEAPPSCTVEILQLRRNVGHQRAVALGLAYVHDRIPCDAILVMDADGEDRPADAARLVQRLEETGRDRIVFAARTRRSESWLFQALYRLYQLFHWLLTGVRVRVGNFSAVPAGLLPALVTLPAMWNHYAAAVFQSRLPYETIPTRRGARYSGRSKMNYLALIMHGLHAISVFSDLVAVRLLIGASVLACGCGALLLLGLMGPWRAPAPAAGWTAYAWGLLLLLVLLTLGCFSLVLNLMTQRNSLDFLPIRDYRFFVDRAIRLSPAPGAAPAPESPAGDRGQPEK